MNQQPSFHFCPRCGSHDFAETVANSYVCGACGLYFFLNPATAVGGIICDADGAILLLRRAKDPGRGKFGLPGGFVDAGETIEAALARELREEVNLELTAFTYLCSFPNTYEYRGLTYSVIDLFFVCQVRSFDELAALDETDSTCFLPPAAIDLDEVAFPSVRQALQRYRDTLHE